MHPAVLGTAFLSLSNINNVVHLDLPTVELFYRGVVYILNFFVLVSHSAMVASLYFKYLYSFVLSAQGYHNLANRVQF